MNRQTRRFLTGVILMFIAWVFVRDFYFLVLESGVILTAWTWIKSIFTVLISIVIFTLGWSFTVESLKKE